MNKIYFILAAVVVYIIILIAYTSSRSTTPNYPSPIPITPQPYVAPPIPVIPPSDIPSADVPVPPVVPVPPDVPMPPVVPVQPDVPVPPVVPMPPVVPVQPDVPVPPDVPVQPDVPVPPSTLPICIGLNAGYKYQSDRLRRSDVLNTCSAMKSSNGVYMVAMQSDGNLVMYNTVRGVPIWDTKTYNKGIPPYTTKYLSDNGDLVVVDSTGAILWSANTAHQLANLTVMQNDGNLATYTFGGNPIWYSDTFGK